MGGVGWEAYRAEELGHVTDELGLVQRGRCKGGDDVRETDRARLRKLVLDLTAEGCDIARLPASKTDLVRRLRELGRDVEASRVEYGAGFSLGVGATGDVWIISGGRREGLFPIGAAGARGK